MARILTTGFEIPNYPDPFVYGTDNIFSWVPGRSNGYALQLMLSSPLGYEVERHATIPGAPAELYLRFAVYLSSVNDKFCQIGSPQTPALITISGAKQSAIVVKVNGTTRITGSYIIPPGGEWTVIELHAKLDDNGVVELRVNGTAEGSWMGDTTPNNDTGLDTLWFFAHEDATPRLFDDLAINDTSGVEDNEWCGDGHVVAIRPTGAGDVTEWTPNTPQNWEAVDDVTPDGDTTYVRSVNAGEKDRYAMGDIVVPQGQQIRRVWVEAVARKEGTGTANTLRVGVKSGATEDWGEKIEVGTNYNLKRGREYTLNPDTQLAWTESDVNAMLVGIKHDVAE